MAVVCPVCREVVHESKGYILLHGSTYHGQYCLCAGSGIPYCVSSDSCCD